MFQHRLALSEQIGEITLYDYGELSVLNSLIPNSRTARQFELMSNGIKVQSPTLDHCAILPGTLVNEIDNYWNA